MVGYLLSVVLDAVLGPITAPDASGVVSAHPRVDLSGVSDAPWIGLPLGTPEAPGLHLPAFSVSAILVGSLPRSSNKSGECLREYMATRGFESRRRAPRACD